MTVFFGKLAGLLEKGQAVGEGITIRRVGGKWKEVRGYAHEANVLPNTRMRIGFFIWINTAHMVFVPLYESDQILDVSTAEFFDRIYAGFLDGVNAG